MNYIWELKEIEKIEKNGLKVFTCFSCGGGSSMGYKLSGYEVLGNVEIDPKIMAVYKANHKPKYPFLMGVQEFKKISNDKLPRELFELDILDGSPPCSTFSIAGSREKAWDKNKKFREGQAEQVLSDLFFDFIDIADKLKPKVIIAENVKGLILGNAKGYVKAINDKLNAIGYDVQLFLLNSASMGVPQRRERTFFVGRRKDLNLSKLELKFNEPSISYKDVEKTLKTKYGKKATEDKIPLWNITPVGKSFSYAHPNSSYFNSCKINPDAPISTITASDGGGAYHYKEPYLLSDEALIKCGTFPIDYNFLNQKVKYLVGMSVPPLMMEKISKQVYIQWFKR
ncbi:MAG: DNA cytosine methyltransferase [Cetobacterium sp.]|uniref:DNA cytosine methyltransferase n=1 Tax=Cetobacterium sp. TaxID=2071632 RepID=UPI002FC8E6DA